MSVAIVLTSAMVIGGLAGALSGFLFSRRYFQRHSLEGVGTRENVDPDYGRVAEAWAKEAGRPEIAEIIAGKLSLLDRLGRRWHLVDRKERRRP